MSKEELRELTRLGLSRELNKILNYYMKVYDEYYSAGSRDSAFIKDLVDSIQGISAILEVYVEHKGIDSGYAIEKLNYSESYIKTTKKYFEKKLEEEECKQSQ